MVVIKQVQISQFKITMSVRRDWYLKNNYKLMWKHSNRNMNNKLRENQEETSSFILDITVRRKCGKDSFKGCLGD